MQNLKLLALDEIDLQILSAHAQDAVLKIGDIEYMPREKRFVFSCNRFVWEESATKFFRKKNFQRRLSVLRFDRVTNVRSNGIDRSRKDDILSLLAISFHPAEDAPAGTIELNFSAGATIHLDVECIESQLTDLGPAWETTSKPQHIL